MDTLRASLCKPGRKTNVCGAAEVGKPRESEEEKKQHPVLFGAMRHPTTFCRRSSRPFMNIMRSMRVLPRLGDRKSIPLSTSLAAPSSPLQSAKPASDVSSDLGNMPSKTTSLVHDSVRQHCRGLGDLDGALLCKDDLNSERFAPAAQPSSNRMRKKLRGDRAQRCHVRTTGSA